VVAELDDAGIIKTEIHRKKPTYATILGVKPLSLKDYSHGGNVLFPGWELFVPKLGINSSQ
jgi:hypothetical protein